mmetsp:Transcript_15984/g.35578  ORF Transcript_15984/g.35578 Transcript_15984/m.35578 type:complete len:400 (-) Transcript_15984:1009-2208(-)
MRRQRRLPRPRAALRRPLIRRRYFPPTSGPAEPSAKSHAVCGDAASHWTSCLAAGRLKHLQSLLSLDPVKQGRLRGGSWRRCGVANGSDPAIDGTAVGDLDIQSPHLIHLPSPVPEQKHSLQLSRARASARRLHRLILIRRALAVRVLIPRRQGKLALMGVHTFNPAISKVEVSVWGFGIRRGAEPQHSRLHREPAAVRCIFPLVGVAAIFYRPLGHAARIRTVTLREHPREVGVGCATGADADRGLEGSTNQAHPPGHGRPLQKSAAAPCSQSRIHPGKNQLLPALGAHRFENLSLNQVRDVPPRIESPIYPTPFQPGELRELLLAVQVVVQHHGGKHQLIEGLGGREVFLQLPAANFFGRFPSAIPRIPWAFLVLPPPDASNGLHDPVNLLQLVRHC